MPGPNKNPHGPDRKYDAQEKAAYDKALKEYTTTLKPLQPATESKINAYQKAYNDEVAFATNDAIASQDMSYSPYVAGKTFIKHPMNNVDEARFDGIRDAGVYNAEHADHNSVVAPGGKKQPNAKPKER